MNKNPLPRRAEWERVALVWSTRLNVREIGLKDDNQKRNEKKRKNDSLICPSARNRGIVDNVP